MQEICYLLACTHTRYVATVGLYLGWEFDQVISVIC